MGSGNPEYDGWYIKLFKYQEDAFNFKPEVSSMFTGVDDERGPGGIIHLGIGETQMMYLLVKDYITGENKIFLGPVYSSYEFKTDYNTRLNDDDWKQTYKSYNPLF